MVALFYSCRSNRAMHASQWLFLSLIYLLTKGSVSAALQSHNGIYPDIGDDEVVIDHLKEYLRDQRSKDGHPPHLPHQQLSPLPPQIPFAVPPSDQRYFLPSEVLRGEDMSKPESSYSDYYSDYYPSDDLIESSHHEAASGIKNQKEQMAETPREGGETPREGGATPRDPPALHNKVAYETGHGKTAENPNSLAEGVNYLQKSRYEAQLPEFFVKDPAGSYAVLSDFYFVALVAGCTAVAVSAVLGAGICYYKLHKSKRDAAEAEYPAYGVTGPNKDLSPGAAERKLAQSAHMFHYQHQKQQMIALEKSSGDGRRCSASDIDSEEEGEEGDYTVYECPGLAPTGEMEVKNPLFSDDPTPVTPAQQKRGSRDSRMEENDDEDECEKDEA